MTKDINTHPGEDYRCLCVFCGESIAPPDGEEPALTTFSFGTGPDEAFCSGVVFLCPEHKDADGVLEQLTKRMTAIGLIQITESYDGD